MRQAVNKTLRFYMHSGSKIFVPAAGLPATDSFTNANGTALPTHNSKWVNVTGAMAINTNSVYANSSGNEIGVRWNDATFTANQYSKAKVVALSGTNAYAMGVAVRMSTSAVSYYGLYGDIAKRYLFKMVAGTWTELVQFATPWAINDIVELRISGNTLTPYLNGAIDTNLGAQTVTDLATGQAGLTGFGLGTNMRLDDWEGGNL